MRHLRRRIARIAAVLLATILALSGCTGAPNRQPSPGLAPAPANTHLLIAEVYSTGAAADGSDQFVRLYNPTGKAVTLTGWSLGDGAVKATFPPGASVGARQSVYVARDAAGFRKVMGAPPDFAWGGKARDGGTPVLTGAAGWTLGRTKGLLYLRSDTEQITDTIVWGEVQGPVPFGWKGPAAPTPEAGEVLDRARDEATWTADAPGEFAKDTDTAVDWRQGTAWIDGRTYRPGQTFFAYPTYQADSVTAYASPDAAYATISPLIDKAQKSVDVNVYDMTLVPFAQKMAAAAGRGVKVRLLLDGGSNISDAERYVAKVVVDGGGEVKWHTTESAPGVRGRYVYNHAKYIVIDGKTVVLQSENLVNHGTSVDPRFGNRGWGIVVQSTQVAAYLSRVFESDWSPAFGDARPYMPGTPWGPPAGDYRPTPGNYDGNYPHPFQALTVRGPVPVTPVLAPDHSLLATKGVIGLIAGAKESVLIEQQYAQVYCHVITKMAAALVGQGVHEAKKANFDSV